LLGTAVVRGYGREHELEADRLGAEYLARTGREPHAMITTIEVLKRHELLEKQVAKAEDREPRTYHGLFSTHPENDKRLQEIVDRAGTLRVKGRRITDPNDYLRRLAGMTYGPSAREGVLRGRRFYHGDLGFTLSFPKGWRVKNLSDRLVASSPDNDALLQLSMVELNKRQSPRDFMRNRLGIKRLQREERLEVNGLRGHTGFSTTDTPWGRRLARYSILFFNNRAYLLLSAVKNEDHPRLYNTPILNAVYSFHPLTESEKRLARELKIGLIAAKEG
ncbi:MAG: M48 family metalloprotease, partial [Gammaproteobacteria bacterium]|nr:M48 family metalloprotease [Gammaproteobacteria bacterium]